MRSLFSTLFLFISLFFYYFRETKCSEYVKMHHFQKFIHKITHSCINTKVLFPSTPSTCIYGILSLQYALIVLCLPVHTHTHIRVIKLEVHAERSCCPVCDGAPLPTHTPTVPLIQQRSLINLELGQVIKECRWTCLKIQHAGAESEIKKAKGQSGE